MFSIGNDELEQTCEQVYAGDLIQHINSGEITVVENSTNAEGNGTLQFTKTKSGDSYLVGVWNKLVNKNFKVVRNG